MNKNQKLKTKFSIRYKFLLVTTFLLVTCVGTYLLLASTEFKNDKRTLVFDFNQSLVTNTASDLDSFFTSLSDKTRMMAFIYREPEQKRKEWIADFMHGQRDLVFIASSEKFQKLDQVFYSDQSFIETYGITQNYFTQELFEARKIPFEKIQIEGQALWNATLPDGPPLIGMGRSVIEEDQKGVPIRQFAVISFVRADRIIKNLVQGRPNEVYVATTDGHILVHAEPDRMISGSVVTDPLIEMAKKQKKIYVGEFTNGVEKFLGAFAHAFGGRVLVISRVSERQAFAAVNKLIFRSLLFASMIVTLAFLVAIFFSRSLTRPLDVLMKGMGQVSEGDLSGQIQVKSKDEIALLAHSFNQMIQDLKKSREELEEINRDLENKVKARTHELELQNQAVKEAQEALLRTTRLAAVGEVAGQAAHEVLNPLTSIISRLNKVKKRISEARSQEAQILLDIKQSWAKDYQDGGFSKLVQVWSEPSKVQAGEKLWDEDMKNINTVGEHMVAEFKSLKEDTDFLISESERIGRIISNFRSLSSARGELKEKSVHELCDRSIKIMADLAQKNETRIVTQFNAPVDKCHVDEDEFIQVMTNLVRNSLQSVAQKKYPPGVGELRVSTQIVDDKLEIHIEDNGMGISDENQKKLFEKNFTTKSKAEGTGIGLSISRRFMRAFNGDLKLHSAPMGVGAHFVLLLPLIAKTQNRSVA